MTDGGFANVRIAQGFHTFFLMPDPQGSLRDKLESIERLQKLFEAFSDIDLLKTLFFLYSRYNSPVDESFISKGTGISRERTAQIMEKLSQNKLVFRSFGTTANGDIAFYMFSQESTVLPLLCFADEILTDNMRDFVMDFSRSKGLF